VNAPAAILRCGVHVPRLRLSRALIAESMSWREAPGRSRAAGFRAIANWDEDAITMAVEAGRACIGDEHDGGATSPRSLCLCSTSAPFADRDDALMVAAALDLAEDVETLNIAASLRAGTGGLLNAARHASEPTLVIASDARLTQPGSIQELTHGDGAAALLVGPPSEHALATLIHARSVASDFVDHYRMTGSRFDYALEERWVRDESLTKIVPKLVRELLAAAGCDGGAVRHFALPAAAGTARRIAEAAGVGTAQRDETVLAECGDAGAALPFLLLAAALERANPGELILAMGIGQGVDALLLRAEDGTRTAPRTLAAALQRRHEESSYVRYLSHRSLLDVDFGMRAERDQRTAHSVAYRKRDALAAFKGGRCERCGTVQFPRSRICVNPECRTLDRQVPHRLAGSQGRVKTFTEDWQAYSARPPYVYGNVEFAEGGNLLMEFTDIEPGELKVDDALRFVYRIKDEDRQRGFRRYFWKATPVNTV
jgi:3-hydroxy-3-methylglutaryl CoA synthase